MSLAVSKSSPLSSLKHLQSGCIIFTLPASRVDAETLLHTFMENFVDAHAQIYIQTFLELCITPVIQGNSHIDGHRCFTIIRSEHLCTAHSWHRNGC